MNLPPTLLDLVFWSICGAWDLMEPVIECMTNNNDNNKNKYNKYKQLNNKQTTESRNVIHVESGQLCV